MKNSLKDSKNIPGKAGRSGCDMILPLAALGLVLLPFFLGFLIRRGISIPMYSLFAVLSPMVGFVAGIAALQRKEHIGLFGKIIAIIAVALPLAFVALVFLFFVGASTGMITFM